MYTRPEYLSLCLLYLLWLLVLPLVDSQDSTCAICTVPTSKCINIRQCPPHLDTMIKESRPEYLHSFVCGWDGEDPKVCCPSDDHVPDISLNSYLTSVEPESRDLPCANRTKPPSYCSFYNDCDLVVNRAKLHTKEEKNNFIAKYGCGEKNEHNRWVCCPKETQNLDNSTIARNWSNGPLLPPYCGISTNKLTIMSVLIGATLVPEYGEFPWMALLGYRSTSGAPEWNCGGSLISSRHVLTAAHCVNQNLYLVRLGELNLDDTVDDGADPIDVKIEKVTIHPEFNSTTLSSDIAVLKLAEEIDIMGSVRAICLPISDKIRNDNLTRKKLYVAGWGATMNKGIGTNSLLELHIPGLDLEQCKTAYARMDVVIDKRVVCAGYVKEQKGTCNGDSGGPLMKRSVDDSRSTSEKAFYVVGIVTGSHRCGQSGYPDVFMRVTEFLEFILQQINSDE